MKKDHVLEAWHGPPGRPFKNIDTDKGGAQGHHPLPRHALHNQLAFRGIDEEDVADIIVSFKQVGRVLLQRF